MPGTVVTLSGLTIANGQARPDAANFPANAGGGVYSDHAQLTVRDCLLTGNSARFGGGLFINSEGGPAAPTTISKSTLSNNSAQLGGGIFNDAEGGSATLTVRDSSLTGNTAFFGGAAIYNDGEGDGHATLAIVHSKLSGNVAGLLGGGIHNDGELGNAAATLDDSTVDGNSAGGGCCGDFQGGGGIFNDGASGNAMLTITRSAITNNSSLLNPPNAAMSEGFAAPDTPLDGPDTGGRGITDGGPSRSVLSNLMYRGGANSSGLKERASTTNTAGQDSVSCSGLLSRILGPAGGGIYNHGFYGKAILNVSHSNVTGNVATRTSATPARRWPR
jgi:hypothetical protein